MKTKEVKLETQKTEMVAKIATVYSDFQELLTKIAQAKKAKEEAKASYNRALDKGDELAMSEALRTIRESNIKVESLSQELKAYPEKGNMLSESVGAVIASAREKLPPAEQALREAQKHLKEVEAMIGHCVSGLRNDLNNLNTFIQNSIQALRKKAE